MSRKGPNLQNIPIRTPEGRRISDSFRKPRHGSAMDAMTQQYLRLHGWNRPPHIASPVVDIALRGLIVPDRVRGLRPDSRSPLERGLDIHNEIAKLLFEGPPADAAEAKARRHAAQIVGFQALYGGSKEALSKHLRREAKT